MHHWYIWMWIWVGFASTNFLSPVRKTSIMTELYDSYKIIIDFIDIKNCIFAYYTRCRFYPFMLKKQNAMSDNLCYGLFIGFLWYWRQPWNKLLINKWSNEENIGKIIMYFIAWIIETKIGTVCIFTRCIRTPEVMERLRPLPVRRCPSDGSRLRPSIRSPCGLHVRRFPPLGPSFPNCKHNPLIISCIIRDSIITTYHK